MPDTLRIRRYVPSVKSREQGGVEPGSEKAPASPPSDDYLSRLLKLLPAPVVALYLFGSNIIPTTSTLGTTSLIVWSIICLGLVVLVTATFTKPSPTETETKQGPDWKHVAIAAVSFIIYLYALGGPFAPFHLVIGFIASLLVAGWTFIVPYFYQGPPVAVVG
jgi:hypothetical protein